MGRDWLHKLQLNWKSIFRIEQLSHNQEPEKDKELQDLLHLSKAYQQIVLDEESRKYVTINTHKGLYQYNRLPFGVSSAPGIFQRTMEHLLQEIPRVVVRVDDILITGSSKSEHLNNLETVLGKIQEAGMKLKQDKCVFLAHEVVYLGHRIDQYGIYPVESKVKAITEAPEPKNITGV
ncbi:unnamed protein product [Mytilus edulis]|uniref:Reverse transcriptase domain-containing protein n=1 Tax=Mytilus edulis TaxID=6550 RepID=A0A8S3SYD4_MYTED|nr:unnamed protein product [Mytilus edulis]